MSSKRKLVIQLCIQASQAQGYNPYDSHAALKPVLYALVLWEATA